MPPTFAGTYLQEPSDFFMIVTEKDMIEIGDDEGSDFPATGVTDWEDLNVNQKTAIVAVLNPLILSAEDIINTYARTSGYIIPLAPVDRIVRDIAVRFVFLMARERRKILRQEAAEITRRQIIGDLNNIARNIISLTAVKSTAVAQTSTIQEISYNEREFTRAKMDF